MNRIWIEAFVSQGMNQRQIAQKMRKHPSTISRELKRCQKAYHAKKANLNARQKRKNAKHSQKKLIKDKALGSFVEEKLRSFWSPQQIAGVSRETRQTGVCPETIYQWVYQDRPDLIVFLRFQKSKYRKRRGSKKRMMRRRMLARPSIETRPAIVDARLRLGDWEADTMLDGSRKQRLLTLVDRASGFVCVALLKQVSAKQVAKATISQLSRFPQKKRRTITFDNGTEFSAFEQIERALHIHPFFAHPYASWERGSNENANGLLRQFFPKHSLFASLTQKEVDTVVDLLNKRPRKRLNFRSPHDVFFSSP